MILKQERIIPEIRRKGPEIGVGVPYKGNTREPPFYKYDKELSSACIGYQKGPKNPYLEELINM